MRIDIQEAARKTRVLCTVTPLEKNQYLSEKYDCGVWLKREDKQVVRSYKIRGAYNKISSLSNAELTKGVICASAGNHAQGVAYTCRHFNIYGTIFMPANTPVQKIERVKMLGAEFVQIFLEGESYDACLHASLEYNREAAKIFIPAFDDEKVISGQGTVGLEITEQLSAIDYLLLPVGGGGLAAGVGTWFKEHSPGTILIGVEPQGAASMSLAFEKGVPTALDKMDPFVDGAAVQKAGAITYPVCKQVLQHLHCVPEGKVSATLLELYNQEAIVAELAGCLSVAALDDFADVIKGKRVVCIISGGNNDILRIEEIKKMADAHEGLHHHLMIRFRHQPDELTKLFTEILGENHYITRIEYERREHGRSTYGLVGIKSRSVSDYMSLLDRLEDNRVEFMQVKKEDFLFKYLV
ncbi:MAG: threonine ammonia-lyase IlvA [Sediminibacterium sp.]